jgi:predicted RNase H-like HicB family nuclease
MSSIVKADKKSAKEYLALPYARIITPAEEGGFAAEILEFSGCFAEGDTPTEAFHNLEEVAEAWIEAALEDGQEIPPPSINQGYAGKVALRLPRDLHRLASRKAVRDGVSLNQCLVTAIAAWVGADNLFERIARKVETKVETNLFQADVLQISCTIGFSQGSYFLPTNTALAISDVSGVYVGNVSGMYVSNVSGMYVSNMNPLQVHSPTPMMKEWTTIGVTNG